MRDDTAGDRLRTHGLTETREYESWCAAKGRCYNPRNAKYPIYGGRGIIMCDEWRQDFTRFLRDMGQCPRGLTLDRIEVYGHYDPGNCRWATMQQQEDNRRQAVFVTHNGRTQTVTQWARELSVEPVTLWMRLYGRGWPIERAMTEPVRYR